MVESPMSAINMEGEFGEELRRRAVALLEEAGRIARAVSPSSDDALEVRVNTLGHALQATLGEASAVGISDRDAFMALAGTCGWMACIQDLGTPLVWLNELRRRSGVAAELSIKAAQAIKRPGDFETVGEA